MTTKMDVPSDLSITKRDELAAALNKLVAGAIALWMEGKSAHWHVVGPRFPMLHELFDAQAAEVYGSIDPLAERVRALGASTVDTLGQADKWGGIMGGVAGASEKDMLETLLADNVALVKRLRSTAKLADEFGDYATANLLQDLLGAAEKRVWFLTATLKGGAE